MIISVRSLLERMKYMLLFIVLTMLLYQLIGLVDGWIESMEKYRPPHGEAVKVYHSSGGAAGGMSFVERLAHFYRHGE